jgi:RNA polymerase sigma factor (sigma-70 family)
VRAPRTPTEGFDPVVERERLARLCRRWTGGAGIAEDVAQEAILVALRNRQRGVVPRDAQAYLTGIARRLCLHHLSRQAQRDAHLTPIDENLIVPEAIAAPDDPLDHLLQAERAVLIERALASLPPATRELLIARYLEDLPLAEVAGRLGLSENAAAVRSLRARDALKRVLTTTLRTEAAAHGLMDTETADGWRETAIFCIRCGRERLKGRFEVGSGEKAEFALHCPTCPGFLISMTSQAAPMDTATVLGGVKGFRAGFNRINRWWQAWLDDAVENRSAPCIRCGNPAITVIRETPAAGGGPTLFHWCPVCQSETFVITLTGLLIHTDEAQAFWRRHPRIRNLGQRPVICEGRPATLAAFADATSAARIEMGLFCCIRFLERNPQ